MVAVLVQIFGSEHLELCEDVVQDALLRALETWKFRGMPDNPRAWLYRTARNKAIDIIRKNKHSQTFDFSDPERALLSSEYTLATTVDQYWDEQHIQNDFLAMMYACCHPDISVEQQVTFILKSLCGFSTREVARAFLTNESTISKRLYRTKEYFRKRAMRPRLPGKEAISERTTAVLNAIYLLFNEGYNSTHSEALVREDLISQALFLCKSLLHNERTQRPEVYALMALMCFHAARSSSRTSTDGELILLPQQDRGQWDHELISIGNNYLNKSAFGNQLSTYHLEAAIAYQHCSAPDFDSTNWTAIVDYYHALYKLSPSPVVHLNRALAILEAQGPIAAMQQLQAISTEKSVQNYYLYHAALGEVHLRLKSTANAASCFQKALELTHSELEKNHLRSKIAALVN